MLWEDLVVLYNGGSKVGFLSNRKLTSGYNKNILCRIREVVSITGFVML